MRRKLKTTQDYSVDNELWPIFNSSPSTKYSHWDQDDETNKNHFFSLHWFKFCKPLAPKRSALFEFSHLFINIKRILWFLFGMWVEMKFCCFLGWEQRRFIFFLVALESFQWHTCYQCFFPWFWYFHERNMKFTVDLNSLPHQFSSFLGLHLLDLSWGLALRFLPVKRCSCNLLLLFL